LNEIGLKSVIEEGFNFLGPRVRIVALTSLRSIPVSKKDFTAAITSSPKIGQATLKKSTENQSRPGALLLFTSIVLLISSPVTTFCIP
jgi:hypothetical protein